MRQNAGLLRPLPRPADRTTARVVILRAGASALMAFLVATPAANAAQKETRFRLRADALTEYTDNLFHYSDAQLDEFDQTGSTGRFRGIDDTEDVVTRLRLRSDYRWDLGKKRDLRVLLNGAYFAHMNNDVADYYQVWAGVSLDVTRRDHLELVADQTIDRFKKNYQIRDTGIFAAADYDQTDVALAYTRDLREQGEWDVSFGYMSRRRRFNELFDSRDQDGDYFQVGTSYRSSKLVRGETSIGLGDVDTNTEILSGIPVNRSYDQLLVTQAFVLEFDHGFDLGFDLDYRRREYSTDAVADTGRHNRVDDYFRLRIKADKELKKGLRLRFVTSFIDNDSDREDPSVETDEVGYEEFTAGVGIHYRF
jgi:hypothetical protein